MIETADRKVMMSPQLMEEWATRDASGNRLSWKWGEPDADGFYVPTITTHADDNLAEKARAALLDELRGEVEGLLPFRVNTVNRNGLLALLDDHKKGAGNG